MIRYVTGDGFKQKLCTCAVKGNRQVLPQAFSDSLTLFTSLCNNHSIKWCNINAGLVSFIVLIIITIIAITTDVISFSSVDIAGE